MESFVKIDSYNEAKALLKFNYYSTTTISHDILYNLCSLKNDKTQKIS